MSTPAWPFVEGDAIAFQMQGLNIRLRAPINHNGMSSGPAASAPLDDIMYKEITGLVLMSSDEIAVFEAWFRDTIRFGSVNFLWRDPVDKVEKTWQLIELSDYSVVTQTKYFVALTIQEIP